MLKTNQRVTFQIREMADHGYGVAYIGKDRLYVKQALIGERGSAVITKKLKQGYVGEVVCLHLQDAHRVKSPCVHYQSCGSCHLLHCAYERQLSLKRDMVCGWLKQAHLQSICVRDVVGMEHPYAYRNKVIVGFYKDKKRKIQVGFYEEFSHRIFPYQHCLLHEEVMDEIVHKIVQLMAQFRIEPYEEDRRRGFLRHVLLRKGTVTEEIMVVLVCAGTVFPGRKSFVQALSKSFPQVKTIIQNVNTRKTSVVLGEQEQVLYGKGYIEDVLLGHRYRISSKSFYQINHQQCEVLYQKALSLLKLRGNERVLDAYCGIGTIGMSIAEKVGSVVGVESNQKAVNDAKENAQRNHVKNIRFVCDDASDFMRRAAKERQHFDVILMDPPRSGSTKEFMDACAMMKAKQIVYVSCDPRTQINDLTYFRSLGYCCDEMTLVDMFPNTMYVETVCLLSKLHSDQHIEVELQMDELDLTAAESKATYEEIKDYVLENTGLKVSSLYIAQVKEKCGIIERVNYNLPKSENSRQPKCPPEKEKAIRDALEHFRMV